MAGSRASRPTQRAHYPTEAEHAETTTRLRGLQTVRAHPFNPTARQKFTASDEKRAAWALLDAATRLRLAGQVDFPDEGTIRGLHLVEDPQTGARWAELGYTRGATRPDAPPRPVITASHEGAATLLRLLDAESKCT